MTDRLLLSRHLQIAQVSKWLMMWFALNDIRISIFTHAHSLAEEVVLIYLHVLPLYAGSEFSKGFDQNSATKP